MFTKHRQKIVSLGLIGAAVVLGACSNSGSGSNKAQNTPSDIQLGTLSIQNYTKQADLSEEEYSKLIGPMNKTCNSFGEYVQVGTSYIRQMNIITGNLGIVSGRTTETVTSVSSNQAKLRKHYDNISISYFDGNPLVSDWVDVTCTLSSSENAVGKHCEENAQLTAAYQNFLSQHPQYNESGSCESSSQQGITDNNKKDLYEKGVYVLQDGTKIPVLVERHQYTTSSNCNGVITTTTRTDVEATTTTLIPSPEDNCGGLTVFNRWIEQDASGVVKQDGQNSLLSAPMMKSGKPTHHTGVRR